MLRTHARLYMAGHLSRLRPERIENQGKKFKQQQFLDAAAQGLFNIRRGDLLFPEKEAQFFRTS